MRANRYHEYGEPNVLQVEDVERPEPDRGEIVVSVEAAGVNPLDTKLRSGAYEWATPPIAPGSDFAGVVSSVGADVSEFSEGDRVFGTGLGIARQGSSAEYVCAPVEYVAQLPENVSFEEGAALALVGVTSWEGMLEKAGLKAGDQVLVHGGSGGVGHVAVQIASAVGASVTATASPEYHDQVEDLGADTVLDYSRDDLDTAIADAGAPDVIMDHRINEHIDLNTKVAAQGGRIVAFGGTDIELTYSNSGMARGKMQTLHHFAMPQMPTYAPSLKRIGALAGSGRISPVIERTYGLDEVDQAHRDVVGESFLGKLVVIP